jgi:hypothetical protein
MKDKFDEYGKRLPWDAEGKYVTFLSDKDILRCDSVPSDRQTCALLSYYEDGGGRFFRNVATRTMMKAAAYLPVRLYGYTSHRTRVCGYRL